MASIFSLPNTGPKPKTHVSKGLLPPFIDPAQPPTKTSPWRQINATSFISSLTITLPSSFHSSLWPQLTTNLTPPQPRYAKVMLTITDILSDPFFTRYIKTGNILLLSEGTPGVSDWVCTLSDGMLRLEMAREVYERCGLQGRPSDRNGGARKHGRDRWVVEMDLRAPATVRGRKWFERLLRAAAGALGQGRLWLFRDLGVGDGTREGGEEGENDVIARFHPTVVEVEPEVVEVRDVLVPSVMSRVGDDAEVLSFDFHDEYYEIIEWLDLVRLASPRVTKDDKSDPYICRYSVPDGETATAMDLRTMTWSGLLDYGWCTQLLIGVIRDSRKSGQNYWLALSIKSHCTEALGQRDGCTIVLRPSDLSVASNAEDISMDDPSTHISDAREGDEGPTNGLQHFMCFEFMDTITT